MLIKSVLVSLAIVQLAFAVGSDELKKDYDRLTNCALTICGSFKQSSDPQSEYTVCQTGCNFLVTLGDKCADKCKTQYTGKQNLIDICTKACGYNNQPVAMENNVAPSDKASNVEPPKPSLGDVIDTLKNEKPTDEKKDETDGVVNNLEDLFNKLVNPNGVFDDSKDPSDPIILSINDKDEDSDENNSSSEEKDDKKVEDTKTQDKKVEDNKPEESTDVSTGFSFKDMIYRAFKLAKDKLNGGNFVYTAKMLENGTLVETIQEPESLPIIDNKDADETPFKILNTLLGDEHHFMSMDGDHDHHHRMRPLNGLQPNWKGVPLPIGKPIIEPLDDTNPPSFHDYRMCRPIKFHFSTLCHDINNFFTCASMRTGLPRWFFLSLILLCTFFFLWLGIFMFSMIRRLKRQERIIYYEEDQLPLYKDIVIEEKIPPTYQAEPLPEKLKLETI